MGNHAYAHDGSPADHRERWNAQRARDGLPPLPLRDAADERHRAVRYLRRLLIERARRRRAWSLVRLREAELQRRRGEAVALRQEIDRLTRQVAAGKSKEPT